MKINSKLFKKVALRILNKEENFICVALKEYKEYKEYTDMFDYKNKKEVKFFSELFDPVELGVHRGIFTKGPWFGDFKDVNARNARVLACLFAYEMTKGEK